jgi:hypothetical protein
MRLPEAWRPFAGALIACVFTICLICSTICGRLWSIKKPNDVFVAAIHHVEISMRGDDLDSDL